jgi:membrane protease YdiL (CAAX protease family)
VKKNITIYTLLALISLLVLTISGMVSGVKGDMLYMIAFALPVLFGAVYADSDREQRESIMGAREIRQPLFRIRVKYATALAPVVFPFVSLMLTVSYITSLVLIKFGVHVSPSPDSSFLYMTVAYAIAPAFLEEMLFRYLPLRLIAPYSRRTAVLISSVYFSVFHMDIAKMPYALIAGGILMAVDVASESVLPSVALHLINNIVSVIWIKSEGNEHYTKALICFLSAVTLISLAWIAIGARKYVKKLKLAFREDGIARYEIMYEDGNSDE